jgi:hypothetical protein
MAAGLAVLGLSMWQQASQFNSLIVLKARNFYGVLKVFEDLRQDTNFHYFSMLHGQIMHGLQFVNPVAATFPTTYFGEHSGVGLAMQALHRESRHVGIAGLGIGTLAAYARTNDDFHLYEINPQVVRLAESSKFTYLSNCRGKHECVLGDARLSLEKEPSQNFDLLALDAFTGDSPPLHLLTREAFQLYQRHVKTNGVIAVNVSNKYVDFEPVLANVAREFNYNIVTIEGNPGQGQWWIMPSYWVLLTRDKDLLNTPTIRAVARPPHTRNIPLWTDDFASLFQVLR